MNERRMNIVPACRDKLCSALHESVCGPLRCVRSLIGTLSLSDAPLFLFLAPLFSFFSLIYFESEVTSKNEYT